MDKIIKIIAGLFLVILALFMAQWGYSHYVEQKYRDSLVSTYSYNCTISTTEQLTNVTFIIPVPVNSTGDSRFTEEYSLRQVTGLPSDWITTLLGSSKSTMIKITAPVLAPSTTNLHLDVTVEGPINTKSPLENGVLYRPVQNLVTVNCPAITPAGSDCFEYTSSIYATYDSSTQARVDVSTSLVAKNEWDISGPASNQYLNSVSVSITGDHRRWISTRSQLVTGIGSYDVPAI
jgi:hypothetical protein